MKALYTLTKTELKLAFREFSGVLFITLTPVGLFILLGVIYGNNPAYEGAEYTLLQQTFPAIITIGIIATGLMGIPMGISDYRDKKILKRFRVTPANPLTMLLAQGISSLLFSLVSVGLVWLVAKIFFGYKMIGSLEIFTLYFLLTLTAMYSLGFLIASIARTAKSSNSLASILYFPMLLVSGATIPYEILPKALQLFSDIMPLNHGIKLLKASSLNIGVENGIISVVYLGGLTVISVIISVKTFKWE